MVLVGANRIAQRVGKNSQLVHGAKKAHRVVGCRLDGCAVWMLGVGGAASLYLVWVFRWLERWGVGA